MLPDPTYTGVSRKYKVAGARATQRALAKNLVRKVYVARDADEKVVKGVLDLYREKNIQVVYVNSMKELGEYCGLRVGASVCGILKESKS